MPDSAPIIASIKSTLRLLVLATVVLYLALGALAVKTYLDTSASTDALCALRADLETRVANSRQFLAEHPKGIPGISPKLIRDGITNQSRTIAALSDLSC